jgi:hypothetical protein
MPKEVSEGKSDEEIVLGADGKHPETVSWSQYVGIKESLGKKLDSATTKLTSLEEQVKLAIKPDEHQKLKSELEAEKAAKKSLTEELTKIKESSAAEKRAILISKGVPEEKVKSLSGESLNTAIMVLEGINPGRKPGADLGSGGGGSIPKGNPRELALQAYSKSK